MNVDGRKLLGLHSIPLFIRIVVALVLLNFRTTGLLYFSAGHQLKARGELKTTTGTETSRRFSDTHPVKGTS